MGNLLIETGRSFSKKKSVDELMNCIKIYKPNRVILGEYFTLAKEILAFRDKYGMNDKEIGDLLEDMSFALTCVK